MMKKNIIFVIIICMMITPFLLACGQTEKPEEPDLLSEHAYLGKFTKKDGTGEIYLGMSEGDFVAFLKQHNIPFEIDRNGASFVQYIIDDYSMQYEIDDGKLSGVALQETAEGLFIGDSVEKMKRLYGNDCVYDEAGEPSYAYKWPNGAVLLICVSGPEGKQTINSIGMGFASPEE